MPTLMGVRSTLSTACGVLSIVLFAWALWGPLFPLLLLYLAGGWIFPLGLLDKFGMWALASFFAPWPSVNLLVVVFLLTAQPVRIRPLAKFLAGIFGGASWGLVHYFGAHAPDPEKLAGNELWHQMHVWAASCSLAAASIILWDREAGRRPAARSAARSRT
jgi:hypothetical protein